MENGINQSVELRILGANTTDFRCGNYGGGGLDAVTGIKFQPSGAGAHAFNFVERSTIFAGQAGVFTFDVHGIARGELASAQVFVSTVQTTKVIRALGGLFQCFFADFVFFFRHISNRKGAESFRCRSEYRVPSSWGMYISHENCQRISNTHKTVCRQHNRHKRLYRKGD
jgi:hypothetical protein